MKKLAFLLMVLFTLTMMAGCNDDSPVTVRFNPETGEALDNDSVASTTITPLDGDEAPDSDPLVIAEGNMGPELKVTSIPTGALETNLAFNTVRGTTPKNTAKIMVNDYTLSKYVPGQTQWSFVASTSFKTLQEGDNSYKVVAYDKLGKEIASTSFAIKYSKVMVTPPSALPSVGPSLNWNIALLAMGTLLWTLRRKFRQS